MIVTEEAYVRAGPGLSYYPTQVLRQGSEVEIYYADPNGWLAIRPPEGSFSWVRSEDIEIGPDGLAEVIREGAPSFIGSLLSSARDYAPVHLRRGELLKVLEVPDPPEIAPLPGDLLKPPGPSAPNSGWVKIAPPSGEFRWVEAGVVELVEKAVHLTGWNQLDPGEGQPPALLEGQEWRPLDRWERPQGEKPGTAPAAEVELGEEPQRLGSPQLPTPQGRSSPKAGADPNSLMLERTLVSQPGGGLASRPHQGTAFKEWVARAEPLRPQPEQPRPSAADQHQQRLDQLSLEFAQMLLLPPAQWSLDQLSNSIRELVAQIPAGTLQEEARALAARIERAKVLREQALTGPPKTPMRELAEDQSRKQPQPPREGISEVPNPKPPESATKLVSHSTQAALGGRDPAWLPEAGISQKVFSSATAQSPFDATGRLMRVLPAGWGVPRYALVDENGNIRAFVTPTSGVNLEYYVGSQIGVNGPCTLYGSGQVPHVMAKSVVPLERLSRR
ncbi:MAG: SH3 domain-containing protein [Thermoguttaceae bacterium]|nr:SH3 domain-containing protein [Thermoguttaceae bacterium]MDW8077324.1 SH3 domain-containing protein [Thermoguttaceae bacterium]